MKRTILRPVLLVLILVLAPVRMLTGGEESEPVARAKSLRATGRYGDAEGLLRDVLAERPGDGPASAELAEVLLETGRLDEAAALASVGTPRSLALAAEALAQKGRLDEAGVLCGKALSAAPDDFRARFVMAILLAERGDRVGAREAFEWFFEKYATTDVTSAEDLTLTAAASMRAAALNPDVQMDFRVTMKLLDAVNAAHEDYLPAYVVKGDLYLATYQDQDAKKAYETALKRNARYPPALLGLANQSAFRFDELSGVGRCREALLTNPNLFAAKEYIARVRIGDSELDEAKELLAQVLGQNPVRKEALSLRAAIEYLAGDRPAFERTISEILALDPAWGRAHAELSGVLEQHRRFAEAAEVARRGTEIDPTDWLVFWARGRNLVHLAEEKGAREALERSRRLDPFAHYLGNPFRENMAEVLSHLEEFVESRTRNFVMKIHVGESAVLSRYYANFLEASWSALTKKYGFEPEAPILAEVFHRHEDFAARTIGLPGIGALGACFGRVITLDSPSARDPGEFSWAATAHHEFAHSMTLGLSRGRVPRWFTEGLSVYEERCYADWWGRDMDRDLFDARHNGEIPGILDFNAEFRSPRVLFAYYLGGLMCEFLAEEFGFAKIVAMLEAYGQDRQTPEVLSTVLSLSPEEYDRRFGQWVERYLAGFRLTPRWSDRAMRAARERLEDDPADFESLVRLAQGFAARGNKVDALTYLGKAMAANRDDPRLLLLRANAAFSEGRLDEARTRYDAFFAAGGDDLTARLDMARILEKTGDRDGAIASFEAAKRCFPTYSGPGNPGEEIARLRLEAEDLDGAMKEIEGFVKLANTNIPRRLELADWYEARGDDGKLAAVLTEVVWIYPLGEKSPMPVHARLGRALIRLGRYEEAAVELAVALELGAPDAERPGLHVDLGEVFRLLGRVKDARREAEAALESKPDSEPAKRLLENLLGK